MRTLLALLFLCSPALLAAQDDVSELKARVEALEKKNGASDGFLSKLGSGVHVYGFLRLDAAYDDSEVNDPQLPQYVISEDSTAGQQEDDESLTLYTKLTRLGFDFDGSPVAAVDGKVSGKLEIDFYGDTSDSRNQPRMRHAYLKLEAGDLAVLAGQTSDLISPIAPIVNSDMVMWNAGNLGDRRPQLRADYRIALDPAIITLQGLAGLGSAVAGENVNGDGITDGEDSGKPVYQARVAAKMPFLFEKQNLEVGAWLHRSWEETDSLVAGVEDDFNSRAAGFDVQVPLYEDLLWAKGEGWRGSNLDDIRGGIGQGINSATGSVIHSRGYWVELGFKAMSCLKLFVGQSVDNPLDEDLTSGLPLTNSNRSRNIIQYVAAEYTGLDPVTVGFEILDWTTEYRGLDEGDDLRYKLYFSYKF